MVTNYLNLTAMGYPSPLPNWLIKVSMEQTDPGEILVSSTVEDLVVGSGQHFVDREVYALKGVPGEWRLFAIEP